MFTINHSSSNTSVSEKDNTNIRQALIDTLQKFYNNEEECISNQSENPPEPVNLYQSALKQFQLHKRLNPASTFDPEQMAQELVQEMESEVNQATENRQIATNQAEALLEVNRICDERISAGFSIISFFEFHRQSFETLKEYFSINYNTVPKGLSKNPIELEIFVTQYITAVKSDIKIYQEVKNILESEIKHPLVIDQIYNRIYIQCENERKKTSQQDKNNSCHEFMHLNYIIKVLGSHLENAYKEFQELHFRNGFGMDRDGAFEKNLNYANKVMRNLDNLIDLMQSQCSNDSISSWLSKDGYIFGIKKELQETIDAISQLHQKSEQSAIQKHREHLASLVKTGGTQAQNAKVALRSSMHTPQTIVVPKIDVAEDVVGTDDALRLAIFILQVFYDINRVEKEIVNYKEIIEKYLKSENDSKKLNLKLAKLQEKMAKSQPKGQQTLDTGLEKIEEVAEESALPVVTEKKDQILEVDEREPEFKLERRKALLDYKKMVSERRENKENQVKIRAKIVGHEILNNEGQQPYEREQLYYLLREKPTLTDFIFDWFKSKEIKFDEVIRFCEYIAKDVLEPSKFQNFRLVDQSGGGSHFCVHIPSLKKDWGINTHYQLLPRHMATINTWYHPKEKGAKGLLNPFAAKRFLEGLEKAGFGVERLEEALKFLQESRRP